MREDSVTEVARAMALADLYGVDDGTDDPKEWKKIPEDTYYDYGYYSCGDAKEIKGKEYWYMLAKVAIRVLQK